MNAQTIRLPLPVWAAAAVLVSIIAAVTATSLLAASPAVGDQAALDVCQATIPAASDYGRITGVVRGETSTAALVADWQERRHPDRVGIVSPLRASSPDSRVTVCLFAGEFVTPVGPPNPDGTPKGPHTILRLLVSADGRVTLDAAGYPGRLDPETPSDFAAR